MTHAPGFRGRKRGRVTATAAAEAGGYDRGVWGDMNEWIDAAKDITESLTIERCAKEVPTNWCDPLLTGKDAPKLPLNERGVEALLHGIQDRIRALKDRP